MEFRDYLLILRKNWLIIALLAVLGTAGGVLATAVATPQYAATAKVFGSITDATTASELQQGSSFTTQRVEAYANLVRTTAVLEPAVEALTDDGIDITVTRLRGMLRATAPTGASVIDITATSDDPAEAATIATTTAHALIEVVEDLETNVSGTSVIGLALVQEAEPPTSPVSPKPVTNVALGLLVGLLAGLAVALIRHLMDNRVRTEESLRKITDLPVIGRIAFNPTSAQRPLVIHSDPASPLAENFRTLRTNLRFVQAGQQRAFVVTSSVQGEGKSTTSANLAIALAAAGARVAIVGADLRRPSLARYFGIEGGIGLTDVLIGSLSLEEAANPWGDTGVTVIASGSTPPNPSELLGSAAMIDLVAQLVESYDVVLFDAPPLLPVTDAAVLARIVGGAILVVAAGEARTGDVKDSLEVLDNASATASGVVLTKLATSGADAYRYGRYGYTYTTLADEEQPRRKGRRRRGGATAASGTATPPVVATAPVTPDPTVPSAPSMPSVDAPFAEPPFVNEDPVLEEDAVDEDVVGEVAEDSPLNTARRTGRPS